MYVRGMFESNALPVLERTLSFTEARHHVLAQNVANAETPGWRRKDLPVGEFKDAMERAVSARERTPGRFEMHPVSQRAGTDRGPFLFRENHAGMIRHDGNSVDLDREMALLGRNALLHNTVAALLRGKYASLRAAVSGRNTAG